MKSDIGVCQRTCAGETVCGDAYVVVRDAASCLVAVIDGLGHGTGAEQAARAACTAITDRPFLELGDLMQAVGAALRTTRGACLTLARIDTSSHQLSIVGVGNVEVVAISRSPIRPITGRGIAGRPLPRLRIFEFPLSDGDRLAIFTDGVSRRVDLSRYGHLGARETAEAIVADHGASHDDATCLVIDYHGRFEVQGALD